VKAGPTNGTASMAQPHAISCLGSDLFSKGEDLATLKEHLFANFRGLFLSQVLP